jgi:hypothetical protein
LIAKTISEKFQIFTSDRPCDRRWVSVKGKTPVRPGTDQPVEWRDVQNRYSWENIQMIPGDYGIILDKTGLTCIDFDKCLNENGSIIDDRIFDIVRDLGTWCEVSSSGRGLHAWIVTDANTRNQKPPGTGIEVITDGHVKVTGNSFPQYAHKPIQMIDGEELIKILRLNGSGSTSAHIGGSRISREKIREGGRNTTLFKLAASLRQKGLSEPAIRAAIIEENRELCDPPLPEAEINRISSSAGNYAPGSLPLKSKEDKKTIQPPGDIYTQIKIADQFIEAHLDGWRYNIDQKKWFFWTGKNWEADDSEQIKNTDKEFLKEYLSLVPNMQVGKGVIELTKFIVSLNTAKGVRDILSIAAPGMTIRDQDLDKDPYLLNCQNGTLDLRTWILRDHDRNDFCPRINRDCIGNRCMRWYGCIRSRFRDYHDMQNTYTIGAGTCTPKFYKETMERKIQERKIRVTNGMETETDRINRTVHP